jgi:hypothetical protein
MAGSSGSGAVRTELSGDMSLFDITFIGAGAMIGAGVFAWTIMAKRDLGLRSRLKRWFRSRNTE